MCMDLLLKILMPKLKTVDTKKESAKVSIKRKKNNYKSNNNYYLVKFPPLPRPKKS